MKLLFLCLTFSSLAFSNSEDCSLIRLADLLHVEVSTSSDLQFVREMLDQAIEGLPIRDRKKLNSEQMEFYVKKIFNQSKRLIEKQKSSFIIDPLEFIELLSQTQKELNQKFSLTDRDKSSFLKLNRGLIGYLLDDKMKLISSNERVVLYKLLGSKQVLSQHGMNHFKQVFKL